MVFLMNKGPYDGVGMVYEGEVNSNNKPHGYGTIYYLRDKKEKYYQGQFVDGLAEGIGSYWLQYKQDVPVIKNGLWRKGLLDQSCCTHAFQEKYMAGRFHPYKVPICRICGKIMGKAENIC